MTFSWLTAARFNRMEGTDGGLGNRALFLSGMRMDSLVRSVATSPRLAVVLGARRLSVRRWIAVAFATLVLTGLWSLPATALVVTNETATTTVTARRQPGVEQRNGRCEHQKLHVPWEWLGALGLACGAVCRPGGGGSAADFLNRDCVGHPQSDLHRAEPKWIRSLGRIPTCNLVRLNAELPGITGATLPGL